MNKTEIRFKYINPNRQEIFRSDDYFNILVFDNFLLDEALEKAYGCFPDPDNEWTRYFHYNEKKFGLSDRDHIPSQLRQVIEELNSDEFTEYLQSRFDFQGLSADPELAGGGLHITKNSGYLRYHTDFSHHPRHNNLQRRLNLIVFLEKEWKPEYGGELEFYNLKKNRIEYSFTPAYNRCIIFETNRTSYHGYPRPVVCPDNISRKSIALYYYQDGGKDKTTPTHYIKSPQDKSSGLLINLENKLLYLYSWLKKYRLINDRIFSTIIRSKK